MLSATAVALLISFIGAFALDDDPVGLRTAYVVVMNWVGAAFCMVAYKVALSVAWARERYWRRVAVSALLVTVPSGVLVWASTWLFGGGLGIGTLPIFFLNTFVMGGAFIAAFVAPAMDAAARRARPAVAAEDRPANFMERLPPKLRGSELWALEAEDHYLKVITSSGETLIRLRLADALRELHAIDGAQTHRSWWVARAAVRDVKRDGSRVALVLPNGREALVSRAFARGLRAARWF
jgi:LytTr DNA-binding domain-containing protein